MAKDPAFLFYPGDWLGGTMHLSWECKGAYMDLLMLQFNRGHMTSHMIGQVLGQREAEIWSEIKDKFETDGKYYWNKRLKQEKEKREAFTASRNNNIKGTNQHSKKKVAHMTSHMEDENEDSILGSNTNNSNAEKIENWFIDLKNGREKETIAMHLKINLEVVKIKIEEFKGFCEIEYVDYKKFVGHFKNWLRLNPTVKATGGMVY